jgi:hypothetical protein
MNLVNPKSIDGYVNHFADYILSYTNNLHIIIKVTFHFPNIIVISGSDHTKTIYNFNKIHKDFLTQFPMYEDIIGTNDVTILDLLHNQHNHKGYINTFWMTLYNTPRPLFNSFQLNEFILIEDDDPHSIIHEDSITVQTPYIYKTNDKLIFHKINEVNGMVFSTYPFGYSKDIRQIMYTSEFIAHNLFRVLKTEKLQIYNNSMTPLFLDEELRIVGNYKYSEKKLVSLVLDTLSDYDLESVVEDYEISKDFFEPIADKPWLESWNVGDMVMF